MLDLISPDETEVFPVIGWLKESEARNIEWLGDVIKAEATVQQVEDMFQTNMFIFEHSNGMPQFTQKKLL